MNSIAQENVRKKKSSFFSRITKRQKTTKKTSTSLIINALDQIPLNKDIAAGTSSQKGSMPIMSVVDSTPPSLESLSSSQSSMDTQSNHEKMQETADSSSSSSSSSSLNRPKSLYAHCSQNFADLDAEFMEIRADRWREEGRTFADLETSAQFSAMSINVEEASDAAHNNKVQIHTCMEQQETKETAVATSSETPNVPLDTTSDSLPLPVLSSQQKEMVEPTSFELDSSLLSGLSAINLVEESFSDEESQASQETQSERNVQTSDLQEDEDLQEEEEEGEEEDIGDEDEDEGAHGEETSGAFLLFSFDYLQERLSCISCV